jgi:ADP-ribosylglycohydrolase
MSADLEDRAIGILLGLAAGDRIGGPLRMALHVAESLCERGGLELTDIGRRYVDWWRNGGFDTGPTAAQVLSLVDMGVPFEQAAIRVNEAMGGMTAGCNPAHRSAPLAMCAAIADSALADAAIKEAELTHRHPLAGEAAAAVVCLCRALMRGTPWPVALRQAAQGRCAEIRSALDVSAPKKLSPGGFAPDVLSAAVYFLNASASFPIALASSIDFAGPANYCPVLVGSIGGARWGRAQIETWSVEHHGDILPRVNAVALALAAGWRNVKTP